MANLFTAISNVQSSSNLDDIRSHLPCELNFFIDDESPLIFAIKQHHLGMVSLLIDAGAEINIHSPETGITPLHIAVFEEQPEILKLLLDKGASPYAQTCDGSYPLHWIGYNTYDVISELLIKTGADINARDHEGNTPLHNVVHLTNMNRVRWLLAHGADPNLQNNEGCTPLHDIVQDSGYFLIELLLDAGADILIKNNKGLTPIDLAKNPALLIDYKRYFYIHKNGDSLVSCSDQ